MEELWDSIAQDQQALELSPEQASDLHRRIAAYELDKNTGRLASEAFDEIRSRL